jgi:RNA polymerase sigma factor (sigma-70 family)
MTDANDREAFFMMLYQKVFPAVCRYVHKRGGTLEEAKDVFQDSIIIYYEKVVNQSVNCKDDNAYLMGIAKHLWLRKFNSRELVEDDNSLKDIADIEEEQPSTKRILHYLTTAGQKCMDLLRAFYYDQLPVQSVAELFGFSGQHSASVQKYKCLEKVRDQVQQKALSYEDFLE